MLRIVWWPHSLMRNDIDILREIIIIIITNHVSIDYHVCNNKDELNFTSRGEIISYSMTINITSIIYTGV